MWKNNGFFFKQCFFSPPITFNQWLFYLAIQHLSEQIPQAWFECVTMTTGWIHNLSRPPRCIRLTKYLLLLLLFLLLMLCVRLPRQAALKTHWGWEMENRHLTLENIPSITNQQGNLQANADACHWEAGRGWGGTPQTRGIKPRTF